MCFLRKDACRTCPQVNDVPIISDQAERHLKAQLAIKIRDSIEQKA